MGHAVCAPRWPSPPEGTVASIGEEDEGEGSIVHQGSKLILDPRDRLGSAARVASR